MGIAILSGILSRTFKSDDVLPPRLPTRFIACVRRPESARRIKKSLSDYVSSLTIYEEDNLRGIQEADIVLLCCKPQMVSTVLNPGSSGPGDGTSQIARALQGKLLISICAGVPVSQIEEILYGSTSDADPETEGRCRIVRAMPNTASFIGESMTVISTPSVPLPPLFSSLTTWIFTQIGRVVYLPPSAMDASTALCGSGPAFFALILEAIADGAVAMGLPRAEAQFMAAQTMRGTAGMVLGGEHPALVREKVGTPGGCTIGGLLVLEEGRVRGTVARAVREATVVASQLGKGVEGVNGTRF